MTGESARICDPQASVAEDLDLAEGLLGHA
jgi:hypothetical protein